MRNPNPGELEAGLACGGPDPNGRSRLGESRPAWYPHNPSGSGGKTAAGRDDGWAPGPEVQLYGEHWD
jgi:hypothetical protein